MRLKGYVIAILLVGCTGAIVAQTTPSETAQSAQSADSEKVSTPEDLDRVMKKSQPALQATGKAIASGAYAEAKTQLATVRKAILDSQNFWVEKHKEDALKMNQETIAKIDAVDKTLSTEPVDAAAATTGLRAVGGACRSCHDKYRAQDADNNYIIKPGSLDDKQ